MAVRLAFASDRNPTMRTGADERQDVLTGKRVLIVDDSASQRRRLREIYESLGLQVVGDATHGLECLTLTERLDPDIISLDVIMPVMHGVETLDYLREKKNRAVVFYVSALGNVEALAEVRSAGGHLPDAIFSKKDGRDAFSEVLTSIFTGDAPSVPNSSEELSPSEVQSPEAV
ncbi:MAG: hypothetical protein RIR26_1428 [Pseudomonadota bacterium]|jgi:two-component system chemotaxis response regulator CheY